MHNLRPGRRRTIWGGLAAIVLLAGALVVIWMNQPPSVQAESNFQRAFEQAYPNARASALDDCRLCHTQGAELNAYGRDFAAHGHSVKGIELLDSDLDGIKNMDEIQNGTFPGQADNAVGLVKPIADVRPNPIAESAPNAPNAPVYKLIGWNDLGMHCMNANYSNLSVLPPFNTLWAQLIQQGSEPRIVTQGVTIEYSIEDNTYSAGKTNFWTYASSLFGVNLAPNVGLKGKGLSGTMDLAGDHFVAEGIPLTPYRDSAPQPVPANLYPYQIAHLVARSTSTGQILAETRPVAPVSDEMHCESCHADGKQQNIATGNVETNILTLHDQLSNTTLMSSRPVLCQKCHGDNALGVAGDPNLPNLSLAMHSQHKVDSSKTTAGDPQNLKPSVTTTGSNNCYLCHPGPATQCLRDVMYKKGMDCASCHGDTAAVANPARRPWIDLPRCETCHGAKYAENANTRYRDSKGHGGVYCEACHGSPHAILPSTQANDNIQNIALQGFPGTLQDCKVCHGTTPNESGPHGLRARTPTPPAGSPTPTTTAIATRTATAGASPTPTRTTTATRTQTPSTCSTKPAKPKLRAPSNGATKSDSRVELDWAAAQCATFYRVSVRIDSKKGKQVFNQTVSTSTLLTSSLKRGHKYYWNVTACNNVGCTKSTFWQFTIKNEKH